MATEYYILKPAVDTPETGSGYPAAASYPDYDFKAPNSAHKLNFREFPDFEPDIRFKLAKGAKLTDMLSQAAISAHGFLINEKLKNAFEQFNIVPHKYFPATIEDHQGNFHNYFWMHIVWDYQSIVNWEQSSFYHMNYDEKINLKFSSKKDYEQKKKELGMFIPIQVDHLSLEKPKHDIFIHPFQASILTTENVVKILRSIEISGLSSSPID